MSSSSDRFAGSSNRSHDGKDGKKSKLPIFKPSEAKIIRSLDERYDEINKIWNQVEKDLKRFQINVDVRHKYKVTPWTPDSQNPDVPHEAHHYLGYVRRPDGWRLCYSQMTALDNDCDHDWKPIAECQLNIRLEALAHYDDLRQAVVEAAKNSIPKLDEAIADFRRKFAGKLL